MTPKALTVRPITQHVTPTPYTSGLYVWKCGTCPTTTADRPEMPSPVICPNCGEVMFYTPVKKDYHDGRKG